MITANDLVVVDDQPSGLKLLYDILDAEGYVVRPANSGEAALAAVRANPPELILLDLYMPGGIDGYEVCRRLKAEEASRNIPVLLISGSTSPEEHSLGLSLGAVDFITKPFHRDELLARVRTHLDLSRLRRSLEMQVQERTKQLQATNARLQAEIIERTQLEARLRQSEKMEAIGQLAGGVAHDFNNQLTGIMGFAEMLSTRLQEDPILFRYVNHIQIASRRASDLTQKLLAFSRKRPLIMEPTSVHDIIDEVIGLLQRSLDKRIVVTCRFDAASAMTCGDPTQLQNAFLNLAINARDAMPLGGELTFATSKVLLTPERSHELEVTPGDFLRIEIADTGTGIPPEVHKHLFEPFFTTKGPGKGTGLGLASVYGTVKSHQGAIRMSSEVGKGTTFIIYLPLHHEATAEEAIDTASPIPAQVHTHILLVDDEEIVRELGTAMLTELGYQVVCCRDGLEALDYIRSHRQQVELVILDLNMPRLSGRETFIALQRIHPGIRVLLASGYDQGKSIQDVIDQGALGFLSKPFTISELSRKVVEVLRKPVTPTMRSEGA